MEKQRLERTLANIAEGLLEQLKEEGAEASTCCFIGHNHKKLPWLADDEDYRTRRLIHALKALVDNLSMRGVTRYIASNIKGFETLAANTVSTSNSYLETSKAWQGVPDDWRPPELEVMASSSSIHDDGRKNSVEVADLIIALLDDEDEAEKDLPVSESDPAYKAVSQAMQGGKPMVVFLTSWLTNDWPDPDRISVVPPHYLA